MDWLYRIYEIASTAGCFAFCGASLAVGAYWSWRVWAPRSQRAGAASEIDDRTPRVPEPDETRDEERVVRRAPAASGRTFASVR